jgi:hypothetical protein
MGYIGNCACRAVLCVSGHRKGNPGREREASSSRPPLLPHVPRRGCATLGQTGMSRCPARTTDMKYTTHSQPHARAFTGF